MQADYIDAHERHWNDAELLFTGQRWANADHLYGMAAECGLKRLMQAFDMPFDTGKDRPAKGSDCSHADGVWARYESYRSGHIRGAGYILPTNNPFADWNISQRYAHQNHFNQVRTMAHQTGASQVCQLIKKAILEGLI
jgi:hypothetical protein